MAALSLGFVLVVYYYSTCFPIVKKTHETALPTSVAQVLVQSRYARHFSFSACSVPSLQDMHTCPELADFIKLNPFGVLAPVYN